MDKDNIEINENNENKKNNENNELNNNKENILLNNHQEKIEIKAHNENIHIDNNITNKQITLTSLNSNLINIIFSYLNDNKTFTFSHKNIKLMKSLTSQM